MTTSPLRQIRDIIEGQEGMPFVAALFKSISSYTGRLAELKKRGEIEVIAKVPRCTKRKVNVYQVTKIYGEKERV